MDLNELDKKVILKCFKVKRGVRTYMFGLHKFHDEVSECYDLCNLIKRNLGTSMAFESQSEKEEKDKEKGKGKGKGKVKSSDSNEDEDEDEDDNEDVDENENSDEDDTQRSHKKGKKNKKDKKGKKNRDVVVKVLIEDPIFSFGGNQITKIKKYLIDNEIVQENEIKL